MNHREERILALEEALAEPRPHRDMELALEPMENYSSTPGEPEAVKGTFHFDGRKPG